MPDHGYFFAENGEPRGPFSIAEMTTRHIAPATLVWREGLAEWARADSLNELAALFAPAPTAQRVVVTPTVTSNVASTFAPTVAPAVAPQQLGYQTAVSETLPASGQATASLVLGIVSMLSVCGFHIGLAVGLPTSILAVVFGHAALARCRNGTGGGRGLARAGLILGYIYLGLCAAVIATIAVVAIIFMMR